MSTSAVVEITVKGTSLQMESVLRALAEHPFVAHVVVQDR